MTLLGASSIAVSHFQMTFCLSLEKTDRIAFLFSSGILDAFTTDPKERKIISCSEFSTKSFNSFGRGFAS